MADILKITSPSPAAVKYRELANIPSIVEARINSKGTKIDTKWSVRNLDKGKMTKYNCTYSIDRNLNVTEKSDFPSDTSHELLSAVSHFDTYRAVIRDDREKEMKRQILEVWQGLRLRWSVDLTITDLHGEVYTDSEFGVLSWAAGEEAVLYIAEKKLPKSEPYLKRQALTAYSGGNNECCPKLMPTKPGEEHIYRQDWGEQLSGKVQSQIVIYHFESERFLLMEGLPDSWCPGQVAFTPDGLGVVGVAWETEPSRLGLTYCTNRPSHLFYLTMDGQMTELSEPGLAVRSPRMKQDTAVWLQRLSGGPHHGCHQLVTTRYNNGGVKTVIDIVETDEMTDNGELFTGIYCQALPQRCFASDGRRVLFATPQPTSIKSYVFNIDTNAFVELKQKDFNSSLTVVDVHNDVVLAIASNMITPGQLFAAILPAPGHEALIKWKRITEVIDTPVSKGFVQLMNLEHPERDESVRTFTAIFAAPKKDGARRPLVVWPHGGPHANFVNAYSFEAAFLLMLDYCVLQVNYRGSTGAGQATVDFLRKRVGTADVRDCKLATETVCSSYPVDKERIGLYGGSHGGFIVAHLSGQYPEVFKAVVARNPVFDLVSMANITDINDWCSVEAGYDFDEAPPPLEAQLLAMRRCSPVLYAHRVRAPTVLMLGAVDRRVPPCQGLEYARRLQANGVLTRVYAYDDNHSLSSLPAEKDSLINGALWFQAFLR